MHLISTSKERDWFFVKEFVTKAGLKARVNQCIWNRELMPTLSLHDHYTGYVQIPHDDTRKFYDGNFDVHGGVTFEGELQDAPGKWAGFDMAHYDDEKIKNPLEYCMEECEKLAEQIVSTKV